MWFLYLDENGDLGFDFVNKKPLDIKHQDSQEYYGLQSVELFSWGIFRKYEKKDFQWFDVYKEKIVFEEQYL